MVNDNIDNLVLEQLRLLRNDVQSFRADLLAELVEIEVPEALLGSEMRARLENLVGRLQQ